MKFRTDINGLRAYAVIAVIIFHFNKQWLSGGFAGVDVFFVISGYLMTSIIFRGLENNNFSIWKFYAARIKRIVPALLFLVIILMIFGYLFLSPTLYSNLAKHSGGSLLFVSNIIYWRESGYFDSSSIGKYLLHTWSLSVEWQFYILYPIALLIFSKFFKLDTLKKIIIVGTVLTLIFSIYASQKWTVAAYFLLPTRMWEMLIGGVAFLYPFDLKKQYEKTLLEFSGLALIIVSFFIITENTIWPGYAALIPTLGAFILLQSNNDKSIFTNNIICQKLGLWSYSLYLWHWSLLAIYNYFGYKIKIWPFLFVTLACGITSYYLIEKRKWNVWFIIFITFISFIAIVGVYKNNGLLYRVDQKILTADAERHNTNKDGCMIGYGDSNSVVPSCVLGNKDSIGVVLIGDSHAYSTATAVSEVINKSAGVFVMSRGACPLTTMIISNTPCDKDNILRLKELKNFNNIPIVLAGRWAWYLSGETDKDRINNPPPYFTGSYEEKISQFKNDLIKTIEELKKTVKTNIYILLPIPEIDKNVPDAVVKRLSKKDKELVKITKEQYLLRTNNIRKVIFEISKEFDIQLLDPSDFLCDDFFCYAEYQDRPIYYDNDHLSEYGNKLLIPMFEKINSKK